MIRSETFDRYYCDEPVSTQIAMYCNKRGITKDMIIACIVNYATDGAVKERGVLIYETKE